jgi:hypothetical protein
MRAAGACQTGVYGSRSSNSAHGVVIKVPGRSEVSASSRRASLVTGDAGVVSARRRDCSALFEIGNSRLSPLFDRLHCLLHGGGRIILGASRCNSVDENCRYALPDPPRRLNRGTILDLTQHRKDVGCRDTLDRRCAKIRKHVSLQGMQHIVGVLFDPMPSGSSHAIRGRRLPMRPPLRPTSPPSTTSRLSRPFADDRFAPIVLKKSFRSGKRNFLGLLMHARRREGPRCLSERRPWSFIRTLRSIAAVESP